jgi:predicted DNA-binding protein with PD1-like motif
MLMKNIIILAILFTQVIPVSQAFAVSKENMPETGFFKSEKIKTYALRLKPGQDLRESLENFIKEANIQAGYIITTVGSLSNATLRLADESKSSEFSGKFEIVSLVGTLSQDGVHLHISLADNTGKMVGGHLLKGCKIYTTAEIIIGESEDLFFTRETDPDTKFKELKIYKK